MSKRKSGVKYIVNTIEHVHEFPRFVWVMRKGNEDDFLRRNSSMHFISPNTTDAMQDLQIKT